jgi:iron-sulfur cluster repair protein YtfE (RIC family)
VDALKLLREDHEKVKKLLSDIESTTERAVKTRTSELAQLKQELTIHEAIEEEIFYPALKDHAKRERSRSRHTRSTASST